MNPTAVMTNTFAAVGVTLAGLWAFDPLTGIVLGVVSAITGATAIAFAERKLAEARARKRR